MSKQGGSMKSLKAAPSDDVAAAAAPASIDDAAHSAPTLPPPASIAPESAAASSVGSSGKSKKKKSSKKKGARKSKAPPSNGETFDLTPSTSAPPVVSSRASTPANEVVAQAATTPEDLDDHDFFRASSAPVSMASQAHVAHDHDHDLHEETRDPRIEKLMTAEVKRRRAHFAKYVKAAVAISLVLCVAAVVRVGIRRNHSDDSTTAMAATSQVRPPPVAVVPEPTAPKPVDPPPVAENTVTDPGAPAASAPVASVDPNAATSAQAPAPSASAVANVAPSAAPSAEPAPATTANAEPAAELDPKAALKEKRKSQQLLDQGKIVDAIQHGEESVKLDPTDAEAWLILGAAYQMKGDQKEAKRCFGSCIKEGKRGPKGECMAMPH